MQKSFCVSEEEKLRRMEEYQEHLQRAKKERIYCNTQIAEALRNMSKGSNPEKSCLCVTIHFSFDCQQTGPEYFKTAKKCGVFGVGNDCTNIQVNYHINEEENPGKVPGC